MYQLLVIKPDGRMFFLGLTGIGRWWFESGVLPQGSFLIYEG